MLIDAHILMSSDSVFQHVIAFTEKDHNPKADYLYFLLLQLHNHNSLKCICDKSSLGEKIRDLLITVLKNLCVKGV